MADGATIAVALASPVLGFAGAWLGSRSNRAAVHDQLAHERAALWRSDAAEAMTAAQRAVREFDKVTALSGAVLGSDGLADAIRQRATLLTPTVRELDRLSTLAEGQAAAQLESSARALDELWRSWLHCTQHLYHLAIAQAAEPDALITFDDTTKVEFALLQANHRAQEQLTALKATVQSAGAPR